MNTLNKYLGCLDCFSDGRCCIGLKVSPMGVVSFKGEAL